MPRKGAVIQTYGRHRQRRIKSDFWSSADERHKTVFSSSQSDLSCSSGDSLSHSIDQGARKRNTRSQKNKENLLISDKHNSRSKFTLSDSNSSSGSQGIFESSERKSRKPLQEQNRYLVKKNNKSVQNKQEQNRLIVKKNCQNVPKNKSEKQTKETGNKKCPPKRGKGKTAAKDIIAEPVYIPSPETSRDQPHKEHFNFSDFDKYSLVISDSPDCDPLVKMPEIDSVTMFTPSHLKSYISSTPNASRHSLCKILPEEVGLRNHASPVGSLQDSEVTTSPVCWSGQTDGTSTGTRFSSCADSRLHLSSIAGSPEQSLVSSHISDAHDSHCNSTLGSSYDASRSIFDVSKDCPAKNLRSAKKPQKFFPLFERNTQNRSKNVSTVSKNMADLFEDHSISNVQFLKNLVENNANQAFVNESVNVTRRSKMKKADSLRVSLEDCMISWSPATVAPSNGDHTYDVYSEAGHASHIQESTSAKSGSAAGSSSRPAVVSSSDDGDWVDCSGEESSLLEEVKEEDEEDSSEEEESDEDAERLSDIEEDEEGDNASEYEEEDDLEGSTSGSEHSEDEGQDDEVDEVTRYMLSSKFLDESGEEETSEAAADANRLDISEMDHSSAGPAHRHSVVHHDKSQDQMDFSPAKSFNVIDVSDDVMMHSPMTTVSPVYHTAPSSLHHDMSCDGSFSHVTPAKTPNKSRITEASFMEVMTPGRCRRSGRVLTARDKILQQCQQEQAWSFQEAIPDSLMQACVKIGEGVYGEVFRSNRNGDSVALKIIPIEGDFPVNDEPQKTFEEILPEIVISRELSALKHTEIYSTPNFVQVKDVSLVKGCYPPQLLDQWDAYNEKRGSENDRPDMFPEGQLFIIFEFEDSGYDLESVQFTDIIKSRSVLQQVACSLAVAEQALNFEHRDLHWGNVLVRNTKQKYVCYLIDGKELRLETKGILVTIIDFTLSRLKKDGCVVFCDLSTDPTLFAGEGDYQFEVYRLMKEENGNNWEPFNAYTNVLWINYLTDKLRNKKYRSTSKEHKTCVREFRSFSRELLEYHSAHDIITACSFFELHDCT